MIAAPYCWDDPALRRRQIESIVACPFDTDASIVLSAAMYDAAMVAPHLPRLHARQWTHGLLREMARSALSDLNAYGQADLDGLLKRVHESGQWSGPSIALSEQTLATIYDLICSELLAEAVGNLARQGRQGIT